MKNCVHLYCDGGVVKQNPSPFGGTWAWVAVEPRRISLDGREVNSGDETIAEACGSLTPKQVGPEYTAISNNFMELFAAYKALKAIEQIDIPQPGVLWTDSEVTMHRLTNGRSFAGIPQWLRLEVLSLRRRGWKIKLVAGHATRKELWEGQTEKGVPTSKWNNWCHNECEKEAKALLTKLKKPAQKR